MPIRTEIWSADDLPDFLAALIETWIAEAFPDFDKYVWAEPDWHVFVLADDEPVSYLGIFERTARVGELPMRLAGIGTVMTPERWRGQGYASAALRRAADFMREDMAVEFGLLVTSPRRFPFYGRLGWQPVPGLIAFAQPGGPQSWTDATMILPLTDQQWPEGPIDLDGLPW